MNLPSLQRRDWLLAIALTLLTFALYWPTRHFDFSGFDDDGYVVENRHVRAGLTLDSIHWALTTPAQSNWHPLTWLSLELDATLFGIHPGELHLHNALLHALASGLLLLALAKLTGQTVPSAIVAALFAWHPQHVESVAWISERKDVLAGLFMMLGLLTYAFYVRQPRWRTYALLCGLLALGLLAKPMLVTFPAVLMLLDYWPLQRFRIDRPLPTRSYFRGTWTALIVEKLPLLGLVLISSVVTYLVQNVGRSVATLTAMPLDARIKNALLSYALYLWRTVWPTRLAFFYPHFATFPGGRISTFALGLSVATLIVISTSALLLRKRMPWLLVGWLWYLGTLVPVIGFVQVGRQALADRYTYTPLIGIFIALVWMTVGQRQARLWKIVAWCFVLAGCFAASVHQAGYWRDTETMARRAIAVVPDDYEAHAILGRAFDDRGDTADAEAEYNAARRINPREPIATFNLAVLERRRGHIDTAERLYREELEYEPSYAATYNNLANLLADRGDFGEALKLFQAGLECDDQGSPQLAHNYALTLATTGRIRQALPLWQRALALDPNYVEAHFRYGQALIAFGDRNAGLQELHRAATLAPQRREIADAISAVSGPKR